jgi:uncharacterized protein YdhG (YjbR/CyaY superfamily)
VHFVKKTVQPRELLWTRAVSTAYLIARMKKPDLVNIMDNKSPKTLNDYIKKYPKDIQTILNKIRNTIKKAAPDATEAISYQIPTFKLGGNLVHFAAFTGHISFFPTSSGVAGFKKELEQYVTSKGTIKFPLDKPIPYGLITKITKYRVKETLEHEKKKRQSV